METLSTVQWAMLTQHRETWYRIGSATGPSDRTRVRETLTALYASIGEPAPYVLWFSSPASALLASSLFQRGALRSLKPQLSQASVVLHAQMCNASCAEIDERRTTQIWRYMEWLSAHVGQALRQPLSDYLWSWLGRMDWQGMHWHQNSCLHASLAHLRQQGTEALWQQLAWPGRQDMLPDARRQLVNAFWGQHDVAALAFVTALPLLGVRYTAVATAHLAWWTTLAQSCGWWWPYEGLCCVADRPSVLHLDDQGRLHAEHGPAMAFADGYALWSYDGLRINHTSLNE